MRSTQVALIDAQPIFRAGVQRVLEETGRYAVVVTAGNGADASELCRRHDVELVVLPVQLPGLTGIEVAERLNQHRPRPHIVLLANDRGVEARSAAARVGAAALLPRDIAVTELITTLDRIVAGENLLGCPPVETAQGTVAGAVD